MNCGQIRRKLSSGNEMPMIGFGTFHINGQEFIAELLDYALAAGYRLIDTAAAYNNEQQIGAALKYLLPKYNLQRRDVFITTKLPPNHPLEDVLPAIIESLGKLDCEYIDLYMIHWPGVSGTTVATPPNSYVRIKTWEQMVHAKKIGLVKDIGVANFTTSHLDELLKNCFGQQPVVNQIEWHPHYHPEELKRFCDDHDIVLQAYSSLGGTNNTALFADTTICSSSVRLNKDMNRLLLKWALQQDIAVIPKSTSKEHIVDNIDLDFQISEQDMHLFSNISKTKKYAWDPSVVL